MFLHDKKNGTGVLKLFCQMFNNNNNLDYIRRYLCHFESNAVKPMDEKATEKKYESH